MKKWICYNLFGENHENVDNFGMVSGLTIVGFLFGSWVYFFVFIPLYFWVL